MSTLLFHCWKKCMITTKRVDNHSHIIMLHGRYYFLKVTVSSMVLCMAHIMHINWIIYILITLYCIILLVSTVRSDKVALEHRGQTVMTEDERYEMVSHSRYVDEVIPNCPWVLDEEFMEKHKVLGRMYAVKLLWYVQDYIPKNIEHLPIDKWRQYSIGNQIERFVLYWSKSNANEIVRECISVQYYYIFSKKDTWS